MWVEVDHDSVKELIEECIQHNNNEFIEDISAYDPTSAFSEWHNVLRGAEEFVNAIHFGNIRDDHLNCILNTKLDLFFLANGGDSDILLSLLSRYFNSNLAKRVISILRQIVLSK